ncbi:MAG: hydroxymethylbilane synthase, partial [bacterium]
MRIRIGTRGSALALWQADHVAARLRELHPGLEVERIIFTTRGDHILDRPLAEIGGKGLFTKELEVALEEGSIDLAVHSLKDMPVQLPAGLVLGAIPVRADVRDCLVVRAGESPDDARRIGTASLRRTCLARRRWPGAEVTSIRGNVPTRVGRVHDEGDRRMDLVILAAAGLARLEILKQRDDI